MSEQLQTICTMIENAFNDETQDINRALQNYKYILTHYKNNSLYGDNCRQYIFNKFLEPSFKLLMKRRHQHFQRDFYMADEITNCCKLLIEIAVPLIQDDHPLVPQIIYFCMNRACPFYRDFGHDWREYRGTEIKQEEIKQNEEWRSTEIKVGSHVDYLLCNRWRYGEITKITDKQSELSGIDDYQLLDIRPKMDGMYPNDGLFTEEWTFSKQTYDQITKPLTISIEKLPSMVTWRRNLGISENNSRCDVLDSNGQWCCCEIIETDPAANRIKVISLKNKVESTCNEWIYRDSPRLQRYEHANDDNFKQSVEDEEDPDDDNLYAIDRGRLGEISYHLVDALNQLGKSGGFEAILQKLTDGSVVSIQFLTLSLRPLSKCWKVYTKSFSDKWLPKMYNALIDTLESLKQTQCIHLTSRDCVRIIAAIGNYGRRHHSAEEIKEIVDKLTFKMLLRRLQCGRDDAATDIALKCVNTNKNVDKTTDTIDELINWIEKNNVFRYLFGFNNVILCKSDVLIEGYTRENYDDHMCLSVDVLSLIKLWFDEDCKGSMMNHSVEVLKFINREYQLTTTHIEMIWNTLLSVTLPQKNINDKNNGLAMFDVVDKLYNIVGPIIMSKCIDNFMKHKYVISTIKILIGIWSSTEKDMRYTIIGHMIDNEKLLKYYCEDIVYFKDCLKNYIAKNEIQPLEINDMKLFNEKINYLRHVTERINFLEYISTNYNDLKFTDNEKDILYTHLIQNALTEQEQKVAISILKSIIEYDDKYPLLK